MAEVLRGAAATIVFLIKRVRSTGLLCAAVSGTPCMTMLLALMR